MGEQMDSIRNRHEFLALRDQGLKQVRAHFILQGRFVSQQTKTAFGLTASKKIGNAVRRNRARRRLRALALSHLPEQGLAGWHYGLIARYPICEVAWQKLETEFCEALRALHRSAETKKAPKRIASKSQTCAEK